MTAQALRPDALTSAHQPPARPRQSSSWWLIGFALFEFACQLALLFPELGAVRVVVRIAAFAASIGLLLLLPGRGRITSVQGLAYVVLAILVLEFVHPEGTVLGSIAQLALYAAILGPVFWVRRLAISPQAAETLFLILWGFYAVSAALGVLQAYFPGQFQPALSSIIADMGHSQVKRMEIQLASGEHVLRPMGLTDIPGGASYGAVYAVLFGLGVLQSNKAFFGARFFAIASMVLGLMCLYLCQVRAALVMLGICILVLVILSAMSGQLSRFMIGASVIAVVVPIALFLAISLGGHAVTDRLSTLVEGDASGLYYKNRGRFLEATIDTTLPKYPLGAGLGRWGMINHYFGSRSSNLYVEIQWTGWLLDGGVPMVLAYFSLIVASSWQCFRIALNRGKLALSGWPAVIVAYNVGALAVCFSYVEFIGTSGLEFWLLNAAVLAAADQAGASAFSTRPL